MGAYTTVPLTTEQYHEIIDTMRNSSSPQFKPNELIAEALVAEANLGIRIEDILALKPSSFVAAGGVHKINIVEKKTKKKRYKTISEDYYKHLEKYIKNKKITKNELIFPITERSVQRYLAKVTYYLEYENISTHSFRKYCGMQLYNNNGYNIILVMEFFQHSSPDITKRYLGIEPQEMERALQNYCDIA